MTQLRQELITAKGDEVCPSGGTAYLMILNAVKMQSGLLHGKLEEQHEYCAIGSYFHVNKRTALTSTLIDEVAAFNDSMPAVTPRQRKLAVIRWLKWKLAREGMPGFQAKENKP